MDGKNISLALLFITGVLAYEKSCITWTIKEENFLSLICLLDTFSLPVSFINPNGEEQAKCIRKDGSVDCRSNGTVIADLSKNEIIFNTTLDSAGLVNGQWQCVQKNRKWSTKVSTYEGIKGSTYVHTVVRRQKNNLFNIVTLQCFSCRITRRYYAEFLVNGRSEGSVKFDPETGKCHSSPGDCLRNMCNCSSDGRAFTRMFRFPKNESGFKISCGMNFEDNYNAEIFTIYTTILVNSKSLTNIGSKTVINKAAEKGNDKTDEKNGDLKYFESSTPNQQYSSAKESSYLIAVGILSTIFVAITCACIIMLYRCCVKTKERNFDSEEDKLLMEDVDNERNAWKLPLLIRIATDVLHKVIEVTLLENKTKMFKRYLTEKRHTLFHTWHTRKRCCQCKSDEKLTYEICATTKQFRTFFDTNGIPDLEHSRNNAYCLCKISVKDDIRVNSINVSNAYWLFKCECISKTIQDERKLIMNCTKVIKDQRDSISHLFGSNSLSKGGVSDKWERLDSAVKQLSQYGGDEYNLEVKNKISKLKRDEISERPDIRNMLEESEDEFSLRIHQEQELRFNTRLKAIERVRKKSQSSNQDNLYAVIDNISIHIVSFLDVKKFEGKQSLDLLIRVHIPYLWDEDRIIETIRRECKQINSSGDIIIKETTIDQFLLIVQMRVETLADNENLKTSVRNFFQVIFKTCNIDSSVQNEIDVSIEPIALDASDSIDPVESHNDVQLTLKEKFFVQKGQNSFVTSCAVWTDDQYIIIDSNNELLIVYNSSSKTTDTRQLFNKPFSMALLNDELIAMSFPELKEVHTLNLKDNKSKPVCCKKLHAKCYTLYKKDDKTVFVYLEDKGVHLLNITTGAIQPLDIQIPLFVPHSDEICFRNNRLYHTERSTRTIFCYDINEGMQWKFEGDLKQPTALTCDLHGNVFVTDYLSSKLFVISADGKSSKVLLTKREKLLHPTFIYFCEKRHWLFLANRDNGYAACYKITYTK